MSSDQGIPCPVVMEDPDPDEVLRLRKIGEETAARKRARSFCLLLSKDLPSSRVSTTEWCSCGSCVSFTTVHENVCCRETLVNNGAGGHGHENEAVRGLRKKVRESEHCIVHHPSFNKIALDREVLRVMIEQMRLEKKKCKRHEVDDNRCFRYCAYRSFVIWCYGRLGILRGFELPACVRGAIMKEFPSDSGSYVEGQSSNGSNDCDDEDWRGSFV
ncbi:unnamed protein product [Haemonchus placei]|uniref:P2X purinoreceptor 7 intracellular domain-containing protein n=1 Tax=Haemonchus placei TaxID=6290 RepID=A0A0N4X144_HAEPC|nr:unnamed protein product [Haemonchus placei]